MNQKNRTAAFISILVIAFGLIVYAFLESDGRSSETVITIQSVTSVPAETEAVTVASSAFSVSSVKSSASVTSSQTTVTAAVTSSADDTPLMIDINSASKEELMKLSGIGDVTADSITAYRNENGRFSNIEELMCVSGIGEAKFSQIKDFIYVENPVYPEPETEAASEELTEAVIDETVSEEVTEEESADEPAPLTLEDCIPINLNTAEINELMLLPYVDEKIAERIIALREQISVYSNVYELLLVDGLSAAQCNEIFDYITVE